jgi:hypothetical protein
VHAESILSTLQVASANHKVCTAHIRRFDCEAVEGKSKCTSMWENELKSRNNACGLWLIFTDQPQFLDAYTSALVRDNNNNDNYHPIVLSDNDLFPPDKD